MLKLHGFDVSNYYNMAKYVLIEKQAPFEAVTVYPGQEAGYLGSAHETEKSYAKPLAASVAAGSGRVRPAYLAARHNPRSG